MEVYQGVGNGLLFFWDQPMREKNQHCLPDELQASVFFKLSRLFLGHPSKNKINISSYVCLFGVVWTNLFSVFFSSRKAEFFVLEIGK
jgi:hypothetical protein